VPGSQGLVDNRLIACRENADFSPKNQKLQWKTSTGRNITGRTSEDDMRASTIALLLSVALGVAACGEDPGTRAVTGGLIGAGAGAGVSALTGGRPATGALIGGGVGAVGGAVTR
jgi:osmotically inducible lipoprotein OsmB